MTCHPTTNLPVSDILNHSPVTCNLHYTHSVLFSTVPPHKSCNARFHRSSNVPESMLPPSMGPLYPDQHPSVPPADRLGPGPYGPPSTYASMSHSMYTPVYDSRRMWRPSLYPRDGGRSNSLPPEVFHSTVYQPPLRERFSSLDSPYCSTAEQRAPMHRAGFIVSCLTGSFSVSWKFSSMFISVIASCNSAVFLSVTWSLLC